MTSLLMEMKLGRPRACSYHVLLGDKSKEAPCVRSLVPSPLGRIFCCFICLMLS